MGISGGSTASLNQQLRALIEHHCDTLRDEAGCIASSFGDTEGLSPEQALKIRNHAHKIKGSSGTIGFAEISADAKRLEDFMRLVVQRGGMADATEREAAMVLSRALQRRVADIAPEQSSLYKYGFGQGVR